MPKSHKPFAEGPIRDKQVISLGFYRTGSQSLKEALTILGYADVFHSSVIAKDADAWPGLGAVADNNIPCLPGYTGKTWGKDEFNTYFGPCEALTDVTPFAEPLLAAWPDAKVILVHREFESWVQSFQNTLVMPSSDGIMAWMSGNIWEPLIGLHITQTAWKMYSGLLGVCNVYQTRNRDIMKAGYERHYKNVRRIVPPEQLLEINLKDLDWEPLCKFLGKKIPDQPFPRLNESKVFRNEIKGLHRISLMAGLAKLLSPVAIGGAVLGGGLWLARSKGYNI